MVFLSQYKALHLNDLAKIADELLIKYSGHKVFAFYGSLGAGKTTFIKEICARLDVADVVNSPTFSIINQYYLRSGEPVFHFDFYRIENLTEAYDIGYEDYIYSGSFCFIEWPDKIEPLIPEFTVRVYLEVDNEGDLRKISF